MNKFNLKKATTITDLHENNILDILCFLQAKSIIRCTCVCKDWANLIYQPCFPQVYFSRGKAPLQLLLERNNCIVLAQLDESLYTASFPANFSIPQKSIFDINIRRIFGISSSVSLDIFTCQVTGWILALSYLCSTTDPIEEQLYKIFKSWYHMYNPITGQYMIVKKAISEDVAWDTGALMLAQKTNQLKLLGFYCKILGGPVEAYVQTIGTNTWRSIGELPCCSGTNQPVFLNGLCHCLNQYYAVIYSFDPEEEIFHVIQAPSCFKKYNRSYLGSLDGCLCLSLTTRNGDCEIWVMSRYGVQDSWTKKIVFSKIGALEPLACLKNGEILMVNCRKGNIRFEWDTYSSMICFDPRSREYRHVGFRKGSKKKRNEENRPDLWLGRGTI